MQILFTIFLSHFKPTPITASSDRLQIHPPNYHLLIKTSKTPVMKTASLNSLDISHVSQKYGLYDHPITWTFSHSPSSLYVPAKHGLGHRLFLSQIIIVTFEILVVSLLFFLRDLYTGKLLFIVGCQIYPLLQNVCCTSSHFDVFITFPIAYIYFWGCLNLKVIYHSHPIPYFSGIQYPDFCKERPYEARVMQRVYILFVLRFYHAVWLTANLPQHNDTFFGEYE